jgi:glyoxylase-like metal-dependent hydrolase (beta-lactamase superfamily II)
VWLWPSHPDPAFVQASVGIITGDEGSVVVDAGRSPGLARRIQAAMDQEGLPPARLLVYTHHHWDHTWGGACAWGVPVVAHELCVDPLNAEAAMPWSHEFLRAEMDRDPLLRPSYAARGRAMADFASWHVVLPTQTFSSRLTLAGGVELEHVGGRHTPESTIVRVPRDGVVFLGDCYYPPPYHLRSPDDRPDLDLLKSIVSDDYEWYVESHAPPWRRTDMC